MNDAAIYHRLIAQGRLPRADALDAMGRPCWRIETLASHWRLDIGELLKALPTRIDGRQYPEVIFDLADFASIEE